MRLSLGQIDILQRWVVGDDNNAVHWSYLILSEDGIRRPRDGASRRRICDSCHGRLQISDPGRQEGDALCESQSLIATWI